MKPLITPGQNRQGVAPGQRTAEWAPRLKPNMSSWAFKACLRCKNFGAMEPQKQLCGSKCAPQVIMLGVMAEVTRPVRERGAAEDEIAGRPDKRFLKVAETC